MARGVEPRGRGIAQERNETMTTEMPRGHTPGPWGRAYDGPGNTVQPGLAGYSIQGTEGIAYNVCREANARLIASAPDLLDTLHRICYGLEVDGRTADGLTKAQAAHMARVAMDKACPGLLTVSEGA